MQAQLQGLQGVKKIADDIIVFGKTRKEHDSNLEQCLQRISNKGLRLNQSKCTFLDKTLSFFGQVFSSQGCKPDPKRVEDLQNAPIPRNVHEVRSLLGMANYSIKYIANFATITSPLRELTKKNAHFEWTEKHQNAFNDLTQALSSAQCLAYFDKDKITYVTVDASPVAVSAILSQKTKDKNDEKVVAYASRALTDVEKRYSQTEKEALAIIWGVEHFHLYLYGNEFTLLTDHKPLEVIYGSRKSKPSARIERWVLRLQPYSFNVVYKPGSDNPADYLSRHPTRTSLKQQKLTEEYVNYLTRNSAPKAMTLEDIKTATDNDRTLKGLRAAIKLNKWHYDIVKQFKGIKDELTVTSNGLILRGSRIVIPEPLQQRAIDLAHETHPGLSKTKDLLREKVWFPNIENMVKHTVDRCIPCQAVGKQTTPEPLAMTDMRTGPWETVHLDFYGPLPSGDYLLVVLDRYSRFPEVEIVKSTKASVVILRLDKIFATHGIPNIVKTDNGPPFNGEEYSRYLTALEITPKFSTPFWPQGNAEAERFMQPLGKILRTAKAKNRPWQQELNRFLLQYRTTPHTTTGVPPAELMFNRAVKGKLPILHKKNIVNRHREARQNEASKKDYHKRYADSRRNAKKSTIEVGDCVLVRQQRREKLTAYFNEVPYTVTHRYHSRITARNKNGHSVTRNASHFKLIQRNNSGETDDEDEHPITHNNNNNNRNNNNKNHNNDNGRNDETHADEPIVRRSTRNTRAPERYGHPVSWNINSKKGK